MIGWPVLVVALAWLGAALAMVVVGIVRLAGGRQRRGIFLIVGGALVVAAPVGALLLWDAYKENEHAVYVQGLDPAVDPEFSTRFGHERLFKDGDTYTFRDAGSLHEVVSWFASEHPEGFSTEAAASPQSNGEVSVWHTALNNIRYDVMASYGSDTYTLQGQVAGVAPTDPAQPTVRIPFPVLEFGEAPLTEGIAIADPWISLDWEAFYRGVTEVTVGDDTITVPTSGDGTATLTFDDEAHSFTVTIDD